MCKTIQSHLYLWKNDLFRFIAIFAALTNNRITKLIEEKLNAFENKCLRKITNTHWKDFNSNRTLREETKQELVSTFIKRRR
jgi:hypothetical protein